ncbi:hypothetical protein HWV62_34539 [Athelia sp. TMB]|nr:hypothetical protein HWV62_34539 [Athelia sp. TMB]
MATSNFPTGLLAVWANPGPQVTTEEFNDWYDNEHVPLRTAHPAFLSAARFSAFPLAPSLSPSGIRTKPHPEWLALYDVTDEGVFSDESYTTLRANRSPREADVVARVGLLDRRMYTYINERGKAQALGFGADGTDATKIGGVITQGFDADEENVEGWLDALGSAATEGSAETEGWIRTRLFRCGDAGRNGTSVDHNDLTSRMFPKYLVVHAITRADVVLEFGTIEAQSIPTSPTISALLRVHADKTDWQKTQKTQEESGL